MDEKIIPKEDLWESAKKMSRGSGMSAKETYGSLCYLLGPHYWTYEYANFPNEIKEKRRATR